MSRRGISVAGLLLLTGVASAQQFADPAFLTKAVTALQQQRNQALDLQAAAEAREAILKEDVARLKTKIDALEKAREAKPAERE